MLKRVMGLIGLSVLGWFAVVARVSAIDLPTVDSAALGTGRNIPWSEPVRIDDPFEGSFIGVFDRNYFFDRILNESTQVEVQSLWSREAVRFLLVTRDRDCSDGEFPFGFSVHYCSDSSASRAVTELFVKINDEVFQVSGENSTFSISSELAQALQNAPEDNVSIRLVTENGETVDSEIGKGTVVAWKSIYTN
jgi:hypothetical protein